MKQLYFLMILLGLIGQANGQESVKYMTIPYPPHDGDCIKQIVVQALDKENKTSRSCELQHISYVPDTVICGKSYRVFQEPVVEGSDLIYKSYYFRQEEQRIYRFYEDAGREMLVYDFSRSPGDIIVKKERTRMKVVDVDQAGDCPSFVKDCGTDRRMLYLRGVDDPTIEDCWIEGIGSLYTGLLDGQDFSDVETFVESMYCSYNPHATDADYARFCYNFDYWKSTVGGGEKATRDEINEYFYNHEHGKHLFEMKFLDDTLYVKGITYVYNPVYIAHAYIDGNNVRLGVNNVYFYPDILSRGGLYKIDMKFPGFNPGTYSVRFQNYDVTDDQIITCGEWIRGDVNGDEKVDISDVVAVVNVMACNETNTKADVNQDGKINISDVVAVIKIIASGGSYNPDDEEASVREGFCPDTNHPHVIDLGIGVKFACCNVGASAPWEYGGYYSWGETEEKDYYDWKTYIYRQEPRTCQDIGDDISGTDYDVAHVSWGGGWHLPNPKHVQLLIDKCTFEWMRLNGVNGRKYTGPNGKSFFLPAAGINWCGMDEVESHGYYWLSTMIPDDKPNTDKDKMKQACCLILDSSVWTYNYFEYRECGLSVRPVME